LDFRPAKLAIDISPRREACLHGAVEPAVHYCVFRARICRMSSETGQSCSPPWHRTCRCGYVFFRTAGSISSRKCRICVFAHVRVWPQSIKPSLARQHFSQSSSSASSSGTSKNPDPFS
jgi:hypothetical protein